ncbi:MAG: hypothetical protein Fur0037_13360 [Planctomycetota bacterium]
MPRFPCAILLPLLAASCGRAAPPQSPAGVPDATAAIDRVHLCVSGELLGKLEPCGCASGQLGGLARRIYQIRLQRNFDLLLEGGNLAEGGTELDLLKWFTAIQILSAGPAPYDAIGVGARDLELPFEEWCAMQQGLSPLVASDIQSDLATWPAKPFIEKRVRDHVVRIASFTMSAPQRLLEGPDPKIRLLPPDRAWERALEGADADALRIAMVHADDEASRRLASSLTPPPDLVISVDDAFHEPPDRPDLVGTVPLVRSGAEGRVLLDLTLARLPKGPRLGYATIPLEGSRTKPGAMTDPDVRRAILVHRTDVRDQGILKLLADENPTANGEAYVGSATCRACHEEAFSVWQKSAHARAWQTLEDAERDPERYGWPVTAYPDCVGCHTVGYRYKTGFAGPAETPDLRNVGCESCHGPGSAHAEDPETKLGKVGQGAPSGVCRSCHDFDQTPDFDYAKYWRLIEHE